MKSIKKDLTRKEYIELANKANMTKEEIKKYLKMHDEDEKRLKCKLPYELLPIGKIHYN